MFLEVHPKHWEKGRDILRMVIAASTDDDHKVHPGLMFATCALFVELIAQRYNEPPGGILDSLRELIRARVQDPREPMEKRGDWQPFFTRACELMRRATKEKNLEFAMQSQGRAIAEEFAKEMAGVAETTRDNANNSLARDIYNRCANVDGGVSDAADVYGVIKEITGIQYGGGTPDKPVETES